MRFKTIDDVLAIKLTRNERMKIYLGAMGYELRPKEMTRADFDF